MIDNEIWKLIDDLDEIAFSISYEEGRSLDNSDAVVLDKISKILRNLTWISVKDKLPESMRTLILTTKDIVDTRGKIWCDGGSVLSVYHLRFGCLGNVGDGDEHWYIEHGNPDEEVVAWMYAPEMYGDSCEEDN